MELTTLARALAASRMAFGAGLVLAPRLAGPTWIGDAARDGRTQVLARAFGARDLVLGAGSLAALLAGDTAAARQWFGAQVATDSVDLLATLAGRQLPGPGRTLAVTLAGASIAVAGSYAARG